MKMTTMQKFTELMNHARPDVIEALETLVDVMHESAFEKPADIEGGN